MAQVLRRSLQHGSVPVRVQCRVQGEGGFCLPQRQTQRLVPQDGEHARRWWRWVRAVPQDNCVSRRRDQKTAFVLRSRNQQTKVIRMQIRVIHYFVRQIADIHSSQNIVMVITSSNLNQCTYQCLRFVPISFTADGTIVNFQ